MKRLERLKPLELLEFPKQSDDFSGDAKFAFGNRDRAVFFIFRLERDDAVFFVEPFECRFAFDHGADDLAILRRCLLLDDHPVAVHDAGADHAVALDLQSKLFSAAHVAGDRQQPFGIFFAQEWFASGHSAEHRDIPGSAQNRFAQSIDDFEGAFADPANVAFLFQSFQMIGDAVGRSDFELLADLGDRRREAFFSNRLEKEIVDRLLPVGQRREHDAYILKIFSVVKIRRYRSKSSSCSNGSLNANHVGQGIFERLELLKRLERMEQSNG
jgi:hypothetical protein